MRAIVQRVGKASVSVSGKVHSQIGQGLLVLIGIGTSDTIRESAALAKKIANLRIFSDETGKLNLCALQTGSSILVVSNFTLYGDCAKGNRPSFDQSAGAREAEALYRHFTQSLGSHGINDVQTGAFGQDMTIESVQSGPVNLIIDTASFPLSRE